MALEKKTTILFPPPLHEHLARVAKQRGTSIGRLIREACIEKYGWSGREEQLKAVAQLRAMALPVSSPEEMKQQSIVNPADLLP